MSDISPRSPSRGLRICLATFGSFGDLHPVLGLSAELQRRGHRPLIATSPVYRDIVERAGFDFAPVRPDLDPSDQALIRRIMEPMRGTERLLTELMPHLRDSHADLERASGDADLLISHPITFAAPVIAQERGMPWASLVLAPMSFFSLTDFPVLAPVPALVRLTRRSPRLARVARRGSETAARMMLEQVYVLRRERGLPPGENPIFEGQHSPHLVLAMFSRVLGAPQPDWPAAVRVTGAVRYDDGEAGLSPDLERFIEAGEPPLVFTLGSAAVGAAGRFFDESARAAMALGRRAVLVAGPYAENRPGFALPPEIMVTEYAPYSALFPRAAIVVHQAGIGTTHQALASGRPQIAVPFAHDQPDNAYRLERIGVARTIRPGAYRAARVERLLTELLENADIERRARDAAEVVRSENGAEGAADAIEEVFPSVQPAAVASG